MAFDILVDYNLALKAPGTMPRHTVIRSDAVLQETFRLHILNDALVSENNSE